ncbi:MAG: peptide deformylase [Candidatus Hermodarchaeota archaeon]
MAIKEVLMIGDPILREKSALVTDFGEELQEIIQDLKDTLTHLQKTKKIGRALAAPQIGYMKKVIYYGLPDRSFVMVNPEITLKSPEKFWVWDSCFSFDVAFFVEIQRYKNIKVEYQNEKGELQMREFNDDLSELVQHETDHLEGILATDHLTDVKKIISRQEWEKRYKCS